MQYFVSVIADGTELATPGEEAAIDVFNDKLSAGGHWVYANGLAWPNTATVIDNRGEQPVFTDGPFVESKEFLAGLWIIEAAHRRVSQALSGDSSASPPMYILLNGAFGIGKTTVAGELRRRLAGAVIMDPEHIGLLLQRLPGYRHTDFQDVATWRTLTVRLGRAVGWFSSRVIVPMTFSNPTYMSEIVTGLRVSGRPVLRFCLTAPLEVVRARLAARGEPVTDARWSWVHRRTAECCAAHAVGDFGERIATEDRSPAVIAEELVKRVFAAS